MLSTQANTKIMGEIYREFEDEIVEYDLTNEEIFRNKMNIFSDTQVDPTSHNDTIPDLRHLNRNSSLWNSRPDTGKTTNVLRQRSILQSNVSIGVGGYNVDTKSSFANSGVPKVSMLKEIAPSLNKLNAAGPSVERKVDYNLHDKIRTVSQNSYYKNMHNMTCKFDKNLHASNNLDVLNRKIQESSINFLSQNQHRTIRPKSSAGAVNVNFNSLTQRRVNQRKVKKHDYYKYEAKNKTLSYMEK